jgi:Ca-activated chloride channel family protein
MAVKTLSRLLVAVLMYAAAPAVAAPALQLDVGLARPVLLAGRKNVAHLRVSLIGRQVAAGGPRPQANVCLAIDRSGSMQGRKMVEARRGAISALQRLRASDIVSVVAYDDVVEVVVPATRASDRPVLEAGIMALEPRGSTALYAGVVKCAAEVRKFKSNDRVNRIILLSDGIANVGPSSPSELGALGARLMEQGISVATVGLGNGYNEDLMAELARRSDGSHAFVERAEDLAAFLDQELASVTEVVASDADVRIRCGNGVKPLRVLGRPADIVGSTVTAPFAKVYGHRQHFFVLELEVDPANAGERSLADVEVAFRDLLANQSGNQRQAVLARFTPRAQEVEGAVNQSIVAELSMLNADREADRAIQMLDRGDVQGAQQILQQNARDLEQSARTTNDKRVLEKYRKAKHQSDAVQKAPQAPEVRKTLKKDMLDAPLQGLKL